ncbi:hypothetical protein BKA91DRAFT_136117 [Yarrowia lipolytica]|nr:hypothetical protein BKA91DRAFT_136117 [Yarrowia lipolytica]KAE8172698.1 hypothetical protein BKA90DRAFT_136755 [Yarrowia lipolytica]RMI94482.1 hypothetical protein BD777DRAFT_131543 [Yarrowia lipolytica]
MCSDVVSGVSHVLVLLRLSVFSTSLDGLVAVLMFDSPSQSAVPPSQEGYVISSLKTVFGVSHKSATSRYCT